MKKENLTSWLLFYAKKSKKNFFLYCTIGLLMVVVWLVLPIIISKQTLLLTGTSYKELYYIAFIIFGINFFYSFLKYFISYHAQKFITTTYKNLHLDIIKNFLNTKYLTIYNHNSGFYIERMTDDTIDISDFFINITDDLIDLFINIGSLITIFLLNKIIFLFYAYFLLLLFLIKKTKTKRYAEEEKKKRDKVDILMSHNLELIRGIKEIKLMNLKNFFLKKAEKDLNAFNKTLLDVGEVERFFLFISNNIRNIFRFLLISLSIYLIIKEKLTVAIALMALNYEDSIFDLLNYTESLLKNIKIFKLSANRIMEILDDTISPKESFGTKLINEKTSPAIQLSNINFAYHKEKQILNNLTLSIPSNTTVAFVGMSGCGKTTLFHLLTKLCEPNQGEIKIFHQNLKDLKEAEIHSNIAIVSQNPYLFSMSIEDNLKLNLSISQEQIINACKIAQIHEEILKMPNGYQTKILEGSTNLSGGQKQRIAIARALLQNTPIILFDEATSALDNDTQKKLQKELKKIKNKTIITIAHRLETIKNHDQIVVLNNGEIVGIGTHQELLNENLIYRNLYQSDK